MCVSMELLRAMAIIPRTQKMAAGHAAAAFHKHCIKLHCVSASRNRRSPASSVTPKLEPMAQYGTLSDITDMNSRLLHSITSSARPSNCRGMMPRALADFEVHDQLDF